MESDLFRKKIEAMPYDGLADAKSIAEAALAPLSYAKSELQFANSVLGEVIADGEAEIARQQIRVDQADLAVADNLRVLAKLEALLG
jgi:hypothetical protein